MSLARFASWPLSLILTRSERVIMARKWHRKLYFNKMDAMFNVLPVITIEYQKYAHYKWRFSIGWLFWYFYFNGEPE